MYTSGSTGEPKGVVVPDRGIVRLVRDTDYVRIVPEDVILQMAPSAFDASTFEIWGALLNGATLAVAPAGPLALSEVARVIAGHRVSVMWLTAPLFHLMVDEEPEALASLRCLLAGGDALSVPHVRRFFSLPERRGLLVNGYGPTEATTFSCCCPMEDWEEGLASVPIGRPIAHIYGIIYHILLKGLIAGKYYQQSGSIGHPHLPCRAMALLLPALCYYLFVNNTP